MMLGCRRILVTGSNGFIGKNLLVRLNELPGVSVISFVRGDDLEQLPYLLKDSDCVVHLAGENRPTDKTAFLKVNTELTSKVCNAIKKEFSNTGRLVPLVFTSSIQIEQNNSYGESKLASEKAIESLVKETGNSCAVLRLPGVFGKWCKPNYNSVVATFCYNIARDLPIQINDQSISIRLVYIDDVVATLLNVLKAPAPGFTQVKVEPEYNITLGDLAAKIKTFSDCRYSLMIERVGKGFLRALYATYVSYLPSEKFSYRVPQHVDARGVFVEMLKTPDSGQISYFTVYPGITRGGHYHHTKTEKFLVIKGYALFRFCHLLTGELYELQTSGEKPIVVDTIPGWVHEITNMGDEEMIVMLWANENFDRYKPDTIVREV